MIKRNHRMVHGAWLKGLWFQCIITILGVDVNKWGNCLYIRGTTSCARNSKKGIKKFHKIWMLTPVKLNIFSHFQISTKENISSSTTIPTRTIHILKTFTNSWGFFWNTCSHHKITYDHLSAYTDEICNTLILMNDMYLASIAFDEDFGEFGSKWDYKTSLWYLSKSGEVMNV